MRGSVDDVPAAGRVRPVLAAASLVVGVASVLLPGSVLTVAFVLVVLGLALAAGSWRRGEPRRWWQVAIAVNAVLAVAAVAFSSVVAALPRV